MNIAEKGGGLKGKIIAVMSVVAPIIVALNIVLTSHGNIDKAEKQNEIFADNFTELVRIADEIVGATREGGMPKALAYVRENKERAEKAVKNLRGVCDYFENLNVPRELKDELTAVRASLPAMRSFLAKYERMFQTVMLEKEFLGYVKDMSESAEELEKNGNFIFAEQEFMREVKRLKSRRQGLTCL